MEHCCSFVSDIENLECFLFISNIENDCLCYLVCTCGLIITSLSHDMMCFETSLELAMCSYNIHTPKCGLTIQTSSSSYRCMAVANSKFYYEASHEDL